MSQWSPVWRVKVASVEYTSTILANLSITSGRSNVYNQTNAGFATIELFIFDQSSIVIDINDSLSIEVKDSTGTYVPIFGGSVVDVGIAVA